MILRWICLGCLAAALAACTRQPPPREIGYLPPSTPPGAPRSALVRQPAFLVWGNVVDRLQQEEGLAIEELDEEGQELVVTYHGDPEPYIDCGWLVRYDDDEPLEQIRASSEETRLVGRLDGRRTELVRHLDLEARMRVRLKPDADGSIVSTDADYRVTKTLRSQAPEEEPRVRHEETVVFESGGSAAFEKGGTVCQPTGALEQRVLDALPRTTVVGSG
jgi:hypothetical protein